MRDRIQGTDADFACPFQVELDIDEQSLSLPGAGLADADQGRRVGRVEWLQEAALSCSRHLRGCRSGGGVTGEHLHPAAGGVRPLPDGLSESFSAPALVVVFGGIA